MNNFQLNIIKIVAIYLAIAFTFGISIPILYGVRQTTIEKTRHDYNTTVVNITGFESYPGTCTYCDTAVSGGGLGDPGDIPDCDTYNGYYAFATVEYSAWKNNTVVPYKGSAGVGMWCSAYSGSAINMVEKYYGPVGTTYNGYYLITNPYNWYWYIPGRDTYLFLIIMAAGLGGITLLTMLFHLTCACCERKPGYTRIEELLV